MAFGNATKGYVKAHAGGGGGGGTSNYEQLINKPSINGVELLGDKSIGSLSGNIQVKLSDIADTNLSNVQNAQTLLYNASSQKWENGSAAGGLTITQATVTEVSTNRFNVDTEGATALLFVGKTVSGGLNYYATEIYPITAINAMTNVDEIVISGTVGISNTAVSNVCFSFKGHSNNILDIAKYGGNMELLAIYKIS